MTAPERATAAALPPGWPQIWWWPLLGPTIPVLLAMVVLQIAGTPEGIERLFAAGLPDQATAAVHESAHRLYYTTAILIHVVVCVAASGYFAILLRGLAGEHFPKLLAIPALLFIGATGFILTIGLFLPDTPIYRLSYVVYVDFFRATLATRDLVTPIAGLGARPIWVLVAISVFIGNLTAVLGASVIAGIMHDIGAPGGSDWAERFKRRVPTLYRCFYVLSAILVTSTLAGMVFYHLPSWLAGLAGAKDATALALTAFADGLTTLWGAIYTLTLFSIVAGPAGVLFARASTHVSGDASIKLSVGSWLNEHGISTALGQTIKNIAVVIAPLLVGPIGSLVQTLAA